MYGIMEMGDGEAEAFELEILPLKIRTSVARRSIYHTQRVHHSTLFCCSLDVRGVLVQYVLGLTQYGY